MKHAICAAALAGCVCGSSAQSLDQEVPDVRPELIRSHMQFLADDLLEGRGTGTRGFQIAAAYVAAQFEALLLVCRWPRTRIGRVGRRETFSGIRSAQENDSHSHPEENPSVATPRHVDPTALSMNNRWASDGRMQRWRGSGGVVTARSHGCAGEKCDRKNSHVAGR